MTYASDTTVPVDRSKADIEKLLGRYGASKFFFGWNADRAVVGFSMLDRYVQFHLPLPRQEDFFTTASGTRRGPAAATRAWEQAQRSAWRALLLCIKAKLESVESGIESFEEAFLSHIMIVDGDGGSTTVGDVMIPQIAGLYDGSVARPQLTMGGDTR